jgi:hypothetical protein
MLGGMGHHTPKGPVVACLFIYTMTEALRTAGLPSHRSERHSKLRIISVAGQGHRVCSTSFADKLVVSEKHTLHGRVKANRFRDIIRTMSQIGARWKLS